MELVIAPPPIADFNVRKVSNTNDQLLNELIIGYENKIKCLTERVTNLLNKIEVLDKQKCSRKRTKPKKRTRECFEQPSFSLNRRKKQKFN